MLLRLIAGSLLVLVMAVRGSAIAETPKPLVPKPLVVTDSVANSDPMRWPGATDKEGSEIVNAPLLRSQDGKVFAGLYTAGSSRMEFESYPVDEFMYFLDGNVRLTSADGTVQKISAGDSVSMPKGWKGVWETSGYVKYYVIYTGDGASD